MNLPRVEILIILVRRTRKDFEWRVQTRVRVSRDLFRCLPESSLWTDLTHKRITPWTRRLPPRYRKEGEKPTWSFSISGYRKIANIRVKVLLLKVVFQAKRCLKLMHRENFVNCDALTNTVGKNLWECEKLDANANYISHFWIKHTLTCETESLFSP